MRLALRASKILNFLAASNLLAAGKDITMKKIIFIFTCIFVLYLATTVTASEIEFLINADSDGINVLSSQSFFDLESEFTAVILDSESNNIENNISLLSESTLYIQCELRDNEIYKIILSADNQEIFEKYFSKNTEYMSTKGSFEFLGATGIDNEKFHLFIKTIKSAETIVYPQRYNEFEEYKNYVLEYDFMTTEEQYDISAFAISENKNYSDTSARNFFYKFTPGIAKLRHTYNNVNMYWPVSAQHTFLPSKTAKIKTMFNNDRTALIIDDKLILETANKNLPTSGGVSWRIVSQGGYEYGISNMVITTSKVYNYAYIYGCTASVEDGNVHVSGKVDIVNSNVTNLKAMITCYKDNKMTGAKLISLNNKVEFASVINAQADLVKVTVWDFSGMNFMLPLDYPIAITI